MWSLIVNLHTFVEVAKCKLFQNRTNDKITFLPWIFMLFSPLGNFYLEN